MTTEFGAIPYTPWLIPLAFVVAGMAWSAFGWYTSAKNPLDFSAPNFDWRRFFKTALAGIAVGVITFGLATGANIEAVEVAVHGGDDLVTPHEFTAAVGIAFGIVVTTSVVWKKVRRPAAVPGGGK